MSFVDDFERTWTFSELVKALAGSPPLPGMTPVSRVHGAGSYDNRSAPTADVIRSLLDSMNQNRPG